MSNSQQEDRLAHEDAREVMYRRSEQRNIIVPGCRRNGRDEKET